MNAASKNEARWRECDGECASVPESVHGGVMMIYVCVYLCWHCERVGATIIHHIITLQYQLHQSHSYSHLPMSFLSSDSVSIITGASNGIGRGIAEYALKHHRSRVCMIDYDAVAGEKVAAEWRKTYGEDKIMLVVCDVTNEKELANAFRKCVGKWGRLDLCVNNAVSSSCSYHLSTHSSMPLFLSQSFCIALCLRLCVASGYW